MINRFTSKKIIARAAASIAGLMLYGLSSSAMATSCTNSFSMGVMGPPALQLIGNSFGASGSYTDCYTFSLSGNADSFGFTLEFDGSARRDIAVTGMTLFGGGVVAAETTGSVLATDSTVSSFSFSNLAIGTYSLAFFVDVTGADGGFLGGGLVGYSGTFLTTGSSVPRTNVPEPSLLALLALGLIGIALSKRSGFRVS
jgi:hypothetical protein